MKTHGSTRISNTLSTPVQQENIKNTRKTFRDLQASADNKENLVGRSCKIKDFKLESDNSNEPDVKIKKLVHKAIQTGEAIITAEDLTSTDEPSEDYWKLLAEQRGEALNNSLQENERLKDHVEELTNENEIYKGMIEESRHLVQALKEMVGCEDSDTSCDDIEQSREHA